MALVDRTAKEVNCKVVYYGPALSGRTTNMQYIYDNVMPKPTTKLITMATEQDRTICFNFIPFELKPINGLKVRLHLYACPGAVFSDANRKNLLKKVDGIIFIADSQKERMDANIESMENFKNNLKTQGSNLTNIPYALQLNKRDLANILTVGELKKELICENEAIFEGVAYKGVGVFDALKSVTKQILQNLKDEVSHKL